jgi:hypothetical protein
MPIQIVWPTGQPVYAKFQLKIFFSIIQNLISEIWFWFIKIYL